MNRTFVIIKPDAFERGLLGQIITRLENMGLYISEIEKRSKNKMWCRRHYANIFDSVRLGDWSQKVYTRLEDFMCSAPLVGIVLEGEDGTIERVRKMIGATNATEAAPGTVRGDLGKYAGPYNLIHASDSLDTVQREVELFFDKDTDA